jgi:hypothetical protein
LRAHKLGRKHRNKLGSSFGKAPFDYEILAVDMAKLTHALREAAVLIGVDRNWPQSRGQKPDLFKIRLRSLPLHFSQALTLGPFFLIRARARGAVGSYPGT